MQSYTDVAKTIPAARDSSTGEGPCYQQQLKIVCGAMPVCNYDGGALQTYALAAGDLAPDGNHLSVPGHNKYADLVWKTFFS